MDDHQHFINDDEHFSLHILFRFLSQSFSFISDNEYIQYFPQAGEFPE